MKKQLLATALILMSTSAFAQSVTGVWQREDKTSKVKFSECGSSICGTIVWTNAPRKDDKNPNDALKTRSTVGVQVFYGMNSTGASSWSGKAYNPEDGKVYTGKMSLAGNVLTTQGCALGGLICKSTSWSRSN